MTYNVFSGTLNPTHFTYIQDEPKHCTLSLHHINETVQGRQNDTVFTKMDDTRPKTSM